MALALALALPLALALAKGKHKHKGKGKHVWASMFADPHTPSRKRGGGDIYIYILA